MEIKTCEEYVLSELEDSRREVARLTAENKQLSERAELLETRVEQLSDAAVANIEGCVMRVVRLEAFFNDRASAEITGAIDEEGNPIPFRVWYEGPKVTYRPKGEVF